MARQSSDSHDLTARWEVQLRKGVLELVILASLREREHYGFELVQTLTKKAAIDVPEGTIYPLLLRLAKDGFIQSELREGEGGAPRKYYTLSPQGRKILDAMIARWRLLSSSVDRLLDGKDI